MPHRAEVTRGGCAMFAATKAYSEKNSERVDCEAGGFNLRPLGYAT